MLDYAYCRKFLRQGIEDSGCVDDGKLVFGDSPLAAVIEIKEINVEQQWILKI
jgi:hypothetical protein